MGGSEMTKEDKQLLVMAIYEYLPHEPIIANEKINDNFPIRVHPKYIGLSAYIDGYTLGREEDNWQAINFTKIYLRPLSTMTEDEKREFEALGWRVDELDDNSPWAHNGDIDSIYNGLEWLRAHFFDYLGLIEKGLAAPLGTEKRYKD